MTKHKKTVTVILLAMLFCGCIVALLTGRCGAKSATASKIVTAQDLNNPRFVIGGEIGTVSLREARAKLPNATFREYTNPGDIYTALAAGKVNAMAYDRPPLEYAAQKREDFVILPDELAVGTSLKNTVLIAQVNEFIRRYRADGTYDDMYNRWIKTKNTRMPDFPSPDPLLETIVIGVGCLNAPMGFLDEDGKSTGFDIEFSLRLAEFLNRKCEFKTMNYEALFPACAGGKIDLAVAQMDATPEREETMLFSDRYIDSPVVLMIRRADYAGAPAAVSLETLNRPGIRIGVPQGAAAMTAGERTFNRAEIQYFNSLADGYNAVRHRKLDAFVFDHHNMNYVVKNNPDLTLLPYDIAEEHIVIGFPQKHGDLCSKVNEFIRQYRSDGTLKKLEDKWFSGDEAARIMPTPRPGTKGTLKFVTIPQLEPFSFVRNGQIVGFDIEVAMLAAENLGYTIQFIPMEFSGFIEAVSSGKADMGGGCITITEERKQLVLFTEADYNGGIVIIVRNETGGEATGGFLDWLSSVGKELSASFDRTFVRENRWKMVLQGLKVTVLITVLAALFGTVLAFPVCFMRRSKRRLWRWRWASPSSRPSSRWSSRRRCARYCRSTVENLSTC